MKAVATVATLILRPLVVVAGTALLLRLVGLQLFLIPSGSMAPALQPGDQIVVTPYLAAIGSPEPRRGDVVVFRRDGKYFVKRVVALPGEHIEIRNGVVQIDGRPLHEPYLEASSFRDSSPAEIVPAASCFVLGDHRSDSIDSRVWGPVERASVVGRARLVVWSIGSHVPEARAEVVTDQSSARRAAAIRWERLLHPIE